jgi:TRAP-type C4-dicarboxylate transport system permease large subunit
MMLIIIFYLFIGCVLEFLSIAVITLPLVFPVLTAAGFDPIATLIIIIMLSQIATITPPLGMAVFAVASIAGVRAEEVFRGILPFFFVCLLLTVLIVIFPQIATWLPGLMYG